MMHGAILSAGAPLYGRAREALAVRPLRPGYLADLFSGAGGRDLLALYAAWGGMPRYWELAEPFGLDLERAVDTLVLDPAGPLHPEPDRLLLEEVPPATALRPLLDVIGTGAHRVSEIAGRLGCPASSLARPLAALTEMGLVRRETPFGSDPRAGKRSLYRIDDPFLRMWFRAVAPARTALAQAPRETRLAYWRRHRPALEAQAWEELCRMAVPFLHRSASLLADLGPWGAGATLLAAQRAGARRRGALGRRPAPAHRGGEVDVAAGVAGVAAVPSACAGDTGRRRPGDRPRGVRAAGDNRTGRRGRRARGGCADDLRRAA
ncbi:MAG: helix-turn-helix transcriptional regulator, partial [Acidobacteria bacterium]|nr:helix-turn-helix transcriptional regulator [Acidobacteriota bacterium]